MRIRNPDQSYLYSIMAVKNVELIHILITQALMHGVPQQKILVRRTDLLAHLDTEEEDTSSDPEEEEASSEEGGATTDSEMSDFDKNFYDEDIDALENIENESPVEERGFSGHALFRSGWSTWFSGFFLCFFSC
jgi:hypothetical protein